ncbi:MAG: ATP-binding cassette domain-containing protein [Candidatus Zeuxoniibacter abyssi]|nr:MAG: ATP-binding cassette domain-containing protein [Candidatus Persebacteraceae bacterium AB1(2)]
MSNFRYPGSERRALSNLSFKASAGQRIGVVGRSGSGKSTLTKLIQRLHLAESGRVVVDGIDLNLADPAWLRRQIGVVLQENLLFNRSVRDNIALAMPGRRWKKSCMSPIWPAPTNLLWNWAKDTRPSWANTARRFPAVSVSALQSPAHC